MSFISEREGQILNFLFKWKVATTMTLKMIVDQSGKNQWKIYRILKRLESKNYIENKVDAMKGLSFWHLTEKGFRVVEPYLNELREVGFASEAPAHDLYVTAFHIGDWIVARPEGIEIVTEQQLRRNYKDYLPEWVPNSDNHRPDGYTRIKNKFGERVVAIEVEISGKERSRYDRFRQFYDDCERVTHVLWVVESITLMNKIKKQFIAGRIVRPDIHNFSLFNDFKSLGWKAKILDGSEKGLTIREYYSNMLSNNPSYLNAISCNYDPILTFFKPVLSPYGYDEKLKARLKQKA